MTSQPRRASALALLLFACAACAGSRHAAAQPARPEIASQPLADALEAFARQSGLQLVYRSEIAHGVTSRGADAGLEPREVLAQLLRGTGLGFRYLNDRTIVIYRGQDPPERLPPRDPPGQAATDHPDVHEPARLAARGVGNDNQERGGRTVGKSGWLSRMAAWFGVCASAVGGGAACAQEAGAAVDNGLEEVVVTAEKRTESAREVPATISVLGADLLAQQGVKDLFQLAVLVPGTTFSRAPDDGLQLTIRGLGTPARTQSFDQSVALFLDGTFLGKGRLYSNAFFDVERVEVIKGTQSTLLGKNSSLGAISIVSKRPGAKREAYLTAGTELIDGGRYVEGAVTLPAGERLRLRFAGRYSDMDGWVHNDYTGGHYPRNTDTGARGTAVYDFGNGGDATLGYQYTKMRQIGNGYQFVDPQGLLPPGMGDGVLDGHKTSYMAQGEAGQSVHNVGSDIANLTINVPVGRNVLTSVTSYADYTMAYADDFDFGIKNSTYFLRAETYSQFAEELRIASPAEDRFSYLAGVFWFDSDWKSAETQIYDTPLAIPPGTIFLGGFTNAFTQKTRTLSGFASTAYRAADRLRVNLGVRYTHESKDATFGRTAIAPFTFWNQVVNPPFLATPLTFSDSFPNGNASVQFDLAREVTLYAGYGRGTKTGGFAESSQVLTGNPGLPSDAGGSAVRSENANSWELGIKGNSPSRRLGYEAALFLTRVADFQDTTFTGSSFDTANVNVETKGVETNLHAKLARDLRVDAALTYANARIVAPSERPVAGAPAWTGNIGFTWDHDVGAGLALFASATGRYRGSMVHQRVLSFRSGPYRPVDLGVGLHASDDRWEVRLSGRNILNDVSADFSGPPADPTLAPSIRADAPSPLRSVRLEGTVRLK